jgi:hypothetical protein
VAVVQQLERRHGAIATDPDQAGGEEFGALAGQRLELELCLGKQKAGISRDFGKFFIIESTANSSYCKNSFGKTIEAPKTESARERPLSSLG